MEFKGKITVKHYLNTRVSPDENKCYPVYIQATISRKTTQYRSSTYIVLTEVEFEKYINGEDFEIEYLSNFPQVGMFTKEFLINEPKRVERSIAFIISHNIQNETEEIEFSAIKSWIDECYLLATKNILIAICWTFFIINNDKKGVYNAKTGKYIHADISNYYRAFTKEETLLQSLRDFKKYHNTDINIPKNDILIWKNIELILRYVGKESVFIDFVYEYEYLIDNINGISNKLEFKEQIKEMIKFDNYYLG